MKGPGASTSEVRENRQEFMSTLGISVEHYAVPDVVFEGNDYCRYRVVQHNEAITADALSTNQSGLPILLPLADCTGAILYDPIHQVLMVSHLGRHSTEQYGAIKSVEYMTATYGSSANDILVWLSPSPNGKNYPLWAFANRSFSDVLNEQFVTAGITPDHIESSPVDTVSDLNYYSHSEYLKGNRDVDGRYAIVAMLR